MQKMDHRMLALALLAVCLPARGQATLPQEAAQTKQARSAEVSAYRVEYTIRELEVGKRLNSRTYTLMLSHLDTRPGVWAFGRIRAGSRVPTGRAEDGENKGRIQYQDVGINIDCQLAQRDEGVALSTNFESSYIPLGPEGVSRIPGAPVIRQVKLMADSHVTLGKPTVVGTVDDVMTNRRYEVEVTVTRVK